MHDFKGCFGDFGTLFHDVDLNKYVFRVWPDEEEDTMASYKRIIGYTVLGEGKILLHIVDAEGGYLEDEALEKTGVEFVMADRFFGGFGAQIYPGDQDETED